MLNINTALNESANDCPKSKYAGILLKKRDIKISLIEPTKGIILLPFTLTAIIAKMKKAANEMKFHNA